MHSFTPCRESGVGPPEPLWKVFSCPDDLEEQQFVAKDLVEWECTVNAFVQQYQSSREQSSRSTVEGLIRVRRFRG